MLGFNFLKNGAIVVAVEHVKELPIGPIENMGSGKLRKIISDSAAATESYLAHQLSDTATAMITPVALLIMLFIMVVEDALTRIDELINMPVLDNKDKKKNVTDYSIELRNVTYRYDNAATNALNNVSMVIKNGEVTAFVGPSGGGKSTTAALIDRFFVVTQGEILIGGVNVKDIPKEQLNDMISYVFQNNKLLKGTIKENLKMAKKDATDAQIRLL